MESCESQMAPIYSRVLEELKYEIAQLLTAAHRLSVKLASALGAWKVANVRAILWKALEVILENRGQWA